MRKNNVLLKVIKNQWLGTDKINLYVKDPFESKYQLLVNRREKVEIKKLKNPKILMIFHKQFMMFMKIYKITVQQRKGKCWYCLMIW